MGRVPVRRSIAILSATVVGLTGIAVAGVASANSDTQSNAPLLGTKSSRVVEGRYIVVLEDDVSKNAVKSEVTAMKDDGVDVTSKFDAALKGYAAKLSASELDAVRADSNVKAVHAVHTVQLPEPSLSTQGTSGDAEVKDEEKWAPWNLDRIDQTALPLDETYNFDANGSGVNAYVIDTGVRTSHQTFDGAVSGYDAIDGDNNADDGNGHGTHVAGTIAGWRFGVAKKATIVAVRVLDDEGSGTTESVVSGIDWVTENAEGPAVANMSLGGGVDEVLDEAVANSIASGVTYAIAAGNDGLNACEYSPARLPEAITVGASDPDDSVASFSNNGECVDIFAPGVEVKSAYNTADDAREFLNGTSMASPHVAGAAALYLQGHPDATPAEVSDALTGSATPDVLSNPGTGSPNLLLNALAASGSN